ncbi:hypothetical protein PHLGIDRAFT_113254 [Phlebiopsis gigantea 11061_1 CR5-6]|uniref:Uncharacterized protein n=1 Tax=Phlebiopsis gigantea (strain 11061_1 CR5-6) TaxID=745531 RepID=A0A0C3PX53_PHLG1|nr:hypothetical protein PHLGIDRAFT_113254 [Phlebiopsis gigantea 11061_1 CR5-6]
MPRLLPRLRQAWDKVRDTVHEPRGVVVRSPRPKKHTGTKRPIAHAVSALSVQNRTRSVLLEPKNPIQCKRDYRYRRAPVPRVYGSHLVKPRIDPVRHALPPYARKMTEQEREWWSSPYLRMLAGHSRRCKASEKLLPVDFLLKYFFVNEMAKPNARLIIPDALEHPKFKVPRSKFGEHIVCKKDVLQKFKTLLHTDRGARTATNLGSFIARVDHLLRVRVLQELELLVPRLQSRPRHPLENPVIRRLTRAEWKQVKETGIIPYDNAVAVLVVPPLNKNPETKQRPTPSEGSQPINEDSHAAPDKPLPPVSTMHLTARAGIPIDVLVHTRQFLPPAKVPLYNGLAAFPLRAQRAALHRSLNRLLAVERRARRREHGRLTDTRCLAAEPRPTTTRARGDQKASHAYVVFSDAKSVLRADTVPLAIALWRIRLWEGQGWDKSSRWMAAGGWTIINPLKLRE